MRRSALLLLIAVPLLTQAPPSMQFHEPTRCVFDGDDPNWAQPAFDDRAWDTRAGSSRNLYLWERCHFAPVPDALPDDLDVQFRCALFHCDGKIETVNAGHIPPYLDGCELPLEPGPPLGIIADPAYPSGTVHSASGTMTFLSDGILEATNPQGELLGFDRLAALTAKSAPDIAAEAQHWGQNDDITVVTVRRSA